MENDMGRWAALLGSKKTDEELSALRARVVAEYEMGDEAFTCDTCPAKHTCEWAFDPYNTHGACLAEK